MKPWLTLSLGAFGCLWGLMACGRGSSDAGPDGGSPSPTITSVSPDRTLAGGADFTLTVNGTNFVEASIINFGETSRATTFVSDSQLAAAIPAAAGTDAVSQDFVYLDPPYLAASQRRIRYSQQGFVEWDHRRFAAWVRELDRRGCLVMVSNSNTPLVQKLYRGSELTLFTFDEVLTRMLQVEPTGTKY